MKNRKAARAMEYLDDGLIEGAMTAADLEGHDAHARHERRQSKMKHTWIKWVAVAAVFVMIASVGLAIVPPLVSGAETVIALDVNPSIEIDINKKEEIKAVRALNAEAEIVIGEMDLKGVDLDVGINAIIGSMLKNGYLSTEQNSILISIDSNNEKKATALKEKLAGEIDALLGGSNIEASVITQDFDRKGESGKADENKISPAKAALISKIVDAGLLDANGVPYSYEVLAGLKVNELKLILESKSLTVDGIEASGTASGTRYITRDEALAIALELVGLAETDILCTEIEMDFDDDHLAMVYEIEFRTAEMKYEYELRAADGTLLEQESKAHGDKGHDHGHGSGYDHAGNVDETFAPDEAHIDRLAALEIAYAAAGVSADAAKRTEIELDWEKGRHVWEIEFKVKGIEYEYTLDAATGEILEQVAEADD